MTDLKAAYGHVARIVDVPSQGVTRLLVELPIEAHAEATALLYGKRVLVTIAPADMSKVPYGLVGGEIKKGGPLSQSAAMIGDNPEFWAYINRAYGVECKDAEDAAEFIRDHCGVTSRADIDHNGTAARAFHGLMQNFNLWRDDGNAKP